MARSRKGVDRLEGGPKASGEGAGFCDEPSASIPDDPTAIPQELRPMTWSDLPEGFVIYMLGDTVGYFAPHD